MAGFAGHIGEILPTIIFFALGVHLIVSSIKQLSNKKRDEKSIVPNYGGVICLAYSIILLITPSPSILLDLLMVLSVVTGILFKLITWGIVKTRNHRQH
jgi:putative Mn2+ efflux pump MntP